MDKNILNITDDYLKVFKDIKDKIRSTRLNSYKKINTDLIFLYFEIWKIIFEKQEKNWWWSKIIENLSNDLTNEFWKKSWCWTRNLKYFLKFYNSYKKNKFVQQLVAQIPWWQNIVILEKCKTEEEKIFYINLTIEKWLSRNVLIHQIEWQAFLNSKEESQNNFKWIIPNESDLAKNILKDKYILNFLWLSDNFKEKEMENKIIENIKSFLLELWSDFCYMWNQYKISLEEKDYFIDLLFYNRALKCLFAIELKIEEFKPEFIWKMNFYLELLDKKVKNENENPSVWIILCKKKNKLVAEYSLRTASKPIAVATYEISKKLCKWIL